MILTGILKKLVLSFSTAKARYLSGGSQGDSSVNTMVPQWEGMIWSAFTSLNLDSIGIQ